MYFMLTDDDSSEWRPIAAGEASDDADMFVQLAAQLAAARLYPSHRVAETIAVLRQRPDAWLHDDGGNVLTVKLWTTPTRHDAY